MPRFLVKATCNECGYELGDYTGFYWFPSGITGVGDTFKFQNPKCKCPPNTEYTLKEYKDVDPRIPMDPVPDLLPKEGWSQ